MTEFMRALATLGGRTVERVIDVEDIDDNNDVYTSGFSIICTDGHIVTVEIDYDNVEMMATDSTGGRLE